MVVMAVFEKQLNSDPLQFGFKNKSSGSNAVFTFKTVVDHYVKCGSTVTVCALDISKAFDRVDHYALVNLLMDRLLPKASLVFCLIGSLNALSVYAGVMLSLFGSKSMQV